MLNMISGRIFNKRIFENDKENEIRFIPGLNAGINYIIAVDAVIILAGKDGTIQKIDFENCDFIHDNVKFIYKNILVLLIFIRKLKKESRK